MDTYEKYYTPTIEELHHGFEFEYFDLAEHGQWISTTYSDGGSYSHGSGYIGIEHLFSENIIRVKRLDRQDIEECKWNFKEEDKYCTFFVLNEEVLPLKLIYDKITTNCRLQAAHPEWQQIYFEGHIKNKSELLKLMKMIGIK